MRCRIDHTAAGGPGAVELRAPEGQLEAWRIADVAGVLAEAEAAARRGRYVAGFVAYEAAPAFDSAFEVVTTAASGRAIPDLPLAWFGLFAESHAVEPAGRPGPDPPPPALAAWRCEIDAPAHAAAVGAIRDAIAAGDAYLVNYTTRFDRAWTAGDGPFDLYCRLVAGHATGYHAYLETADWVVACGSPELFFDLSSGRLVTRPMKGTAPRGRWAEEDAGRARALQASAKERAENVMVVDLLRNDLGRIAVVGSVAVPRLYELERHPTLWQLTSTVTAMTPDAVGLADVFGALFPSASVTGAPKVSAMGVVAELERSPRGVYCGAVGMVRPDPSAPRGVAARFAVAIRTAVVDKARRVVAYGSGGGITWDSSPGPEWEEVSVKTRALTGADAAHGLIETMGVDPRADGGTIRNLGAHLARLAASAEYFGLPVPAGSAGLVAGAERRIADAVRGLTVPTRLRLVLRPDGAIEVTTSPLGGRDPGVQRLCVDLEPVDSKDVTLFHKTTDRRRYDERSRRHPGADDVVLVNERAEVTETTRANLAARLDGRWCTPPLDCGLLPGVERSRLLAEGRLVERVVTVDELRGAASVATFSSLRGWRAARVGPECRC